MTDSTIQSILHPYEQANPHDRTNQWRYFPNGYELEHLHRKFWIQGESRNILLNPPEPEDEGDDDDIGPNCHILDIGMPTLGLTKLWIRNEYIRMYKHCEDHLESNRNESKSPAVVVTGQPGIGKSYWIYYVLCRRLSEKKPVLWYRDSRLYLFVRNGVYESPKNISSALFQTRVWTLVDVDNDKLFPPVLSQQGTNNLIIFATSPKKERWASLEETTTWDVAIMNPWTRREISEAAPIHGLAGNDPDIDEMYNRFGPTPRICFELSKRKSHLNEHRYRFEAALSSLSSRVLQGMVARIFDIDKFDISLTILLLKRLPGDDFSLPTVEIITPTAEMAVLDQLNKDTRNELSDLHSSLARFERSRRLARVVYRMFAQESLLRGNAIRLQLYPMVRRTPDGSGPIKKLPRWYANRGGDPSSSLSLDLHRTGIDVFDPKAGPIKNNVYYKLYQAAVDSFIMVYNQLYIFQFATATELDVKKGILTLFSQASLPPRSNWHFVFVIFSNLSELSCPQGQGEMKEFLEEIHLYTMTAIF